jgi:hypothetical protein
MKAILLTFVILILFCNLYAQSPQSFQYQAVVRDVSSNAVTNQNIGFKISIISGSITGTVVYVETHTANSNSIGIVTLNIGVGNPILGSFSSINWGSASHFIKVEADPAGGTSYLNMGTTQLLSVPYSLYSENTRHIGDTVWTKLGNNIYNNNDGNVGVGINNPSGRMVVQGSTTALPTEPLFEVKNKTGQTVFVVYQDSVSVFVNDDAIQANRGGFAVSGRNNSKVVTHNYLKVTPDSTRIYTGDTIKGFGIKNISPTAKTNYLNHGKQRFTSSGSYTVPAGVTTVWVSMCGGGGGGNGYQAAAGCNGGGGANAVISNPLTVIPGSTHSITIGVGGIGTTYTITGGNGGSSSFGSLLTTAGGFGGAALSGGGGGAGGSGGSAGSPGIATSGGVGVGGNGGGSIFGSGGAGCSGGNGGGFGGGGGGANSNTSGGNGSPGFVLVEW